MTIKGFLDRSFTEKERRYKHHVNVPQALFLTPSVADNTLYLNKAETFGYRCLAGVPASVFEKPEGTEAGIFKHSGHGGLLKGVCRVGQEE